MSAYVADKPDKEEFVHIVIDSLYLKGIEGEIAYQPESFSLKLPDDNTFFLANHYLAYCNAAPAAREKVVDNITQSLSQPAIPATYEAAKKHLRPVITTLTALSLNALAVKAAGYNVPQTAHVPFCGEFVQMVAFDSPFQSMQIPQEQFEKWGVTKEEALNFAKSRLRDDSTAGFIEIMPGVWQSDWNDGYDSARILYPDLYKNLPVKEQFVAMMPNRNYLLLTGSEDEKGLIGLADLAFQILDEEPHPLSSEVLILDGTIWKPMQMDPTRASHQRLEILQKNHLFNLYDQQKQFLDKLYEDDEDTFVATLNAREDDNNNFLTYVALTEGVTTLLPKADLIVFVPDDGEPFSVSWGCAKSVMQNEFKPQDQHPERYLVEQFPSQEQLSILMGNIHMCRD